MLQTLKKLIVQHRGDESKKSSKGRCSRTEVRWCGKDDSFVDVHANVRLWGMQYEIDRHAELSTAHLGKSALEISEMVD